MDRDLFISELKESYGQMLGAAELVSLLGFKTHDSCMRALRSGALGVPTFRLPGRPGHYVLTEDYVDWVLAARKVSIRSERKHDGQLNMKEDANEE